LRIAYDPPCHLLHAQGVADPPRRVLAAIPDAELIETPGAARCCGSAGLYGLVQPEMSRAVLAPKIDELRVAAPDVVATGNPGCQLQIGAGLAAAGVTAEVRHPVELLDRSYRVAGYYA
jgi:glycolate oxidase iron-sulfur subunit